MGHIIIWGSPDDAGTWIELDELLRTRWSHPLGGPIRVDACAVDSGDGDWMVGTQTATFMLSEETVSLSTVITRDPSDDGHCVHCGFTGSIVPATGLRTMRSYQVCFEIMFSIDSGVRELHSASFLPWVITQLVSHTSAVRWRRKAWPKR